MADGDSADLTQFGVLTQSTVIGKVTAVFAEEIGGFIIINNKGLCSNEFVHYQPTNLFASGFASWLPLR